MTLETILHSDELPSIKRTLRLVWMLSVPSILAQITSVLMQYIDAAMVGNLGADASASIGLVSTSMWLVYGLSNAAATGFSVQAAQFIGAGDEHNSRQTVRSGVVTVALFSLLVAASGALISFRLPRLLGAEESIQKYASQYFFIFSLSVPVMMTSHLCLLLIQASGNMKLSGALSACTCVLDVLFNALFIYVLGLGVAGAALGTAAAELIVAIPAVSYTLFYAPKLKLQSGGSWRPQPETLRPALKIGLPMAFEQTFFDAAYILGTKIIAPLGNVALAANAFGVTAESLCYMPGYGISMAAGTLSAQSVGAGRSDLAKRFSWSAVALGMLVMTTTAVLMFFACPYIFAFFTRDQAVRDLGVRVLRIEVFAEPFFAASIVCQGALRGLGDTLVPAVLNLTSMWGVRLVLMLLLCRNYGLTGAWIAMAAELLVRGIIFLFRLRLQKFQNMIK